MSSSPEFAAHCRFRSLPCSIAIFRRAGCATAWRHPERRSRSSDAAEDVQGAEQPTRGRASLLARIAHENAPKRRTKWSRGCVRSTSRNSLPRARRSLRCIAGFEEQRSRLLCASGSGDCATRTLHRREDSASRSAGRSHAAGCAGAHGRGENARGIERDGSREPRDAARAGSTTLPAFRTWRTWK